MTFPAGTARLELWQVDVFADRPLAGNPAAVVFGADGLDGGRLQAIARETNLSETVFVFAPRAGGDYGVRIFTTRREIPFAGHPSLAAAHAFSAAAATSKDRLRQECDTGLVELFRDGDWYVTLPPAEHHPAALAPAEAAGLFGLAPAEVAAVPGIVATGVSWLLVEVAGLAAFERIVPDFQAIAAASRAVGAVGLVPFVTDAGPGIDARLRAFAPAEGIFEDPVCGSCAGSLAAHLARRNPAGRYLFAEGAEIHRPGHIRVVAATDGRLSIGGTCHTVLRGRLDIGD